MEHGRAGYVVEEIWLLGRDRLGIVDELDGLVGEIASEVVALLWRARLVDRMVVVDEIRIPLIGLGAEEAIEALEPASGWPVAAGGGKVHLIGWAEVPLADNIGVPAGLTEDL